MKFWPHINGAKKMAPNDLGDRLKFLQLAPPAGHKFCTDICTFKAASLTLSSTHDIYESEITNFGAKLKW